ncbi:hypothetical protein SELMODRAFT_31620, partial [Selaginella moellendorffii]
ARSGDPERAKEIFDAMPRKDVISWNATVSAYAQNGHSAEAMVLFDRMPQHDVVSWNAMITSFGDGFDPESGFRIFAEMEERNLVSWNAILEAHTKSGHLSQSISIFDRMPQRSVISWNLMIAANTRHGNPDEAERFFDQSPELDAFSWTTLLTLRSDLGQLQEAMACFTAIRRKNNVSFKSIASWNTLLTANAQNWHIAESRLIFEEMEHRDASSWNSIVCAYFLNGIPDRATDLFRKMPAWNVISWNTMITGYAHNDRGTAAIQLFRTMDLEGFTPERATFIAILGACSSIPAIDASFVDLIQALVVDAGLHVDRIIANALISLYAKSGSLERAARIFHAMAESDHRDVVTWNAMIAAHARSGNGKLAIWTFHAMLLEGLIPDAITLMVVLSSCSHAGLVDQGWQILASAIAGDHSLALTDDHFACLADLLARSGRLGEAEEVVTSKIVNPGEVLGWKTLLGASKNHGNIDLATRSAEWLFRLDQKSSAASYILL